MRERPSASLLWAWMRFSGLGEARNRRTGGKAGRRAIYCRPGVREQMITLYDYLPSQNAYKVGCCSAILSGPTRRSSSAFSRAKASAPISPHQPDQRRAGDRARDGRVLAELNAILWFLASGTPYLPDDLFAQVQSAAVAVLRGRLRAVDRGDAAPLGHDRQGSKRPEMLVASKRQGSLKCLAALDAIGRDLIRRGCHDRRHSVFAYVHRADEAGVPLSDYRNVVAWIDRIRAQPRYPWRTIPVFDRSVFRKRTALSVSASMAS